MGPESKADLPGERGITDRPVVRAMKGSAEPRLTTLHQTRYTDEVIGTDIRSA